MIVDYSCSPGLDSLSSADACNCQARPVVQSLLGFVMMPGTGAHEEEVCLVGKGHVWHVWLLTLGRRIPSSTMLIAALCAVLRQARAGPGLRWWLHQVVACLQVGVWRKCGSWECLCCFWDLPRTFSAWRQRELIVPILYVSIGVPSCRCTALVLLVPAARAR